MQGRYIPNLPEFTENPILILIHKMNVFIKLIESENVHMIGLCMASLPTEFNCLHLLVIKHDSNACRRNDHVWCGIPQSPCGILQSASIQNSGTPLTLRNSIQIRKVTGTGQSL